MRSTMRSTTLFTILLLSTTTLAAPTRTQPRTHCRCILLDDLSSPFETPSAAHWTPANWKPTDPTPSASPYHQNPDQCADLGPELDHFRLANPDLYESYVRDNIAVSPYPSLSHHDDHHSNNNNNNNHLLDNEQPLPTQVLMSKNAPPRPTARPSDRIMCYAEPESFSAYNGSSLTLWALQIIVAITVLACVAEAIHLAMRWFCGGPTSSGSSSFSGAGPASEDDQSSSEKALRLPGAERLLLAIPAQHNSANQHLASPGAEKKLRAYEATRYFVVKSPSGRREFIAYDSDDDDEANRPVM